MCVCVCVCVWGGGVECDERKYNNYLSNPRLTKYIVPEVGHLQV